MLMHKSGAFAGSPVGDGWWIGLEGVYQNLVFFHSFYDPTVPEHLGIWAVDTTTKTTRWARPDLSFICLTADNQILAYREATVDGVRDRYFLTLDALTGNEGIDLGHNIQRVNEIRATAVRFEEAQAVELPEKLDDKKASHHAALTLAEKHSKVGSIIAGYDAIVQNERIILGFHEQTSMLVKNQAGTPVQALNYVLKVIENDKVTYEDAVGKAMGGLIMDGFFVRHGKLYYVREKDTLCCVAL